MLPTSRALTYLTFPVLMATPSSSAASGVAAEATPERCQLSATVQARMVEASKTLLRVQKGKGISKVISDCRNTNLEIKVLKKANTKILRKARQRRARLVKRIEGVDDQEAECMMELIHELKTRREVRKK